MRQPRWLVDAPRDRVAPADVRAALREVDPVTELVCVDGRSWLLGRVVPNRDRFELGAYMARLELGFPNPNYVALREAQLLMQGFAHVADYTGEPGGHIVEDFRRRSYLYEYDPRRAIRAATDATAGLSEEEKFRLRAKIARVAASDASRWAFNRPRSVHMPGRNPLNPN